jgi:hypothetical protein
MIEALFLLSLLLVAAIGGIPSVLFARLIRWSGLPPTVSALVGSLILALIWVIAMTGGRFAELGNVPWTLPVVTLVAGSTVSAVYFRSHA